ncbi:MAG: class I SAM-dependent methyltransferase [Casimicrobiaceae bacterium]
MSKIEAAYDSRYFDEELHRHHWFRNNARKRARRWREVLRMLEPKKTDRILEIGCAAGAHALRLAASAGEIVGIDSAFAGVRRAQAHAVAEHIHNAEFVSCDAAALPFSDAAFDKVAAIDFVEHVPDSVLQEVLGEVRRVLRPGGRFAIYTPCATHYVERLKARNFVLRQIPGHVAVRSPDAYCDLLGRAAMRIEALWFCPSDYPGFGALDRVMAGYRRVGNWFRFRICIVAIKALR